MPSIRSDDVQFLRDLGTGTDVVDTFDNWRAATPENGGQTVHQVKPDHSNVEECTRGKEVSTTQIVLSKEKDFGVSGKTKVGAGPTIPGSGALKAGVSKSRKENVVESKKVGIVRWLAFKDEMPSFPTKLEEDMYKYVIEWLGEHQSSASHSTALKIEDVHIEDDDPVKRFNQYTSQLEKYDDVSNAISDYITSKKITHYVSSIGLGARKHDSGKRDESRTDIDGRGDINVVNIGGGGVAAHRRSQVRTGTHQALNLGDYDRVCADGAEATKDQLAIVRIGITPISELIGNPRIKDIVDKVIREYHERKKRGLIGPVWIWRDEGLSNIYWCVDDKAGTIKGTSDRKKSSKFYLEDKGKGFIYIFYYEGDETGANKRRLAVIGTELPSTKIIIAKVKGQYKSEPCNLEFEMMKRDPDPKDKEKMTVTDWLSQKDSVHLRVRSPKHLKLKHFWPKFYLKLNADQAILFHPKDDELDLSDDALLFLCESSTATGRGHLAVSGKSGLSHGSHRIEGESTASFIADSEPPTQSDSSPTAAEISDYPRFSTLVSEDYVFPDLETFED